LPLPAAAAGAQVCVAAALLADRTMGRDPVVGSVVPAAACTIGGCRAHRKMVVVKVNASGCGDVAGNARHRTRHPLSNGIKSAPGAWCGSGRRANRHHPVPRPPSGKRHRAGSEPL